MKTPLVGRRIYYYYYYYYYVRVCRVRIPMCNEIITRRMIDGGFGVRDYY